MLKQTENESNFEFPDTSIPYQYQSTVEDIVTFLTDSYDGGLGFA